MLFVCQTNKLGRCDDCQIKDSQGLKSVFAMHLIVLIKFNTCSNENYVLFKNTIVYVLYVYTIMDKKNFTFLCDNKYSSN